MSEYNTFTADIDGLLSSVKLEWTVAYDGMQAAPNGSTVADEVSNQTIYYTDVYEATDGSGPVHENKSIDVGTDLSATITGLTSDREYQFTIRGTDNGATPVTFHKSVKKTPNQPPHAPVFTLLGGNAQVTITVTNHKAANKYYEVFINGDGFNNSDDATATIRTVAVDSTADVDAGTFSFTITGLTNTTDENTYNYEIGLQATTDVKTSAMSSGSQAVQASDRLAKVTSMSVLTGIGMGNYLNQGVLRFTGATSAPSPQQYYWKAFPKGTSNADMMANSKSNPATWSQAEVFNADYVFNAPINGLDLDKMYRFAVVPATIAKGRSHISIAHFDAALSGLPGTAGIAIEIKSGIDISNGLDTMLDAAMTGNLQIRYSMTEAQFQALDNGSALTDLYFDLSGSDNQNINDVSMSLGAEDLSSGIVNFTGLDNDVDYKVRVFTVNANGTSEGSAYTSAVNPSTLPSNLALTAEPADNSASPYLANGPRLFNIDADASGNGALPLTFMFDVSGVDNSMKKEKLTKAQVNALPLALGKQYNIDVKVSNRNGEQDDVDAITIRPSAPPSVKGTTFGETQIDISSASITEVKVNLANMQREDYGYGTKGAIVQLVHESNNNGTEYASDEKVIGTGGVDYNDGITFNIADFASDHHHTNFRLKITPFNAVYGSDYTVAGTAPEGYSITVPGLNTFTTPSFSVVTQSADISVLSLASLANDKDKSLKFKWKSGIAGDKVELLVARAQLHTNNTSYSDVDYADYKLIGEMTTVKYDSDLDNWMTYELSNNLVLADGSTMPIVNGDKYHFMVRDKDYPMRGDLTSNGVPAGLPIISDMKLHDYTANNEDLVTFKINPNGSAISDVFVIDNLSSAKFVDLVDNNIYTATTIIRGDVYVRVNQGNASGLDYSSDVNSNNLYVNAVAGNACGITVGTAISSVTDQTGNSTPGAIYTAANSALSSLATIKTDAGNKRNAIEAQTNNIYGVADSVTTKSPADLKYDAIFALHALAVKAEADTNTAKSRGLQYDVTTGTSNGKTAQQCLADAQTLQQELNNMLVAAAA